MIKKLTIALLLAAGTLFAQITDPVPIEFKVQTTSGVEADLPVTTVRGWIGDSLESVRGLSLDLPYYFSRNVVQLMASSRDDSTDYTNWENENWDVEGDGGTHGDDAVNYLTDAQGISLTGTGAGDGIHLDFTDLDMAVMSDGDTSVAADYIILSAFVPTGDSTKLGGNALDIVFPCDVEGTLTNYFLYPIPDTDLADNAWTHFKITKSSFEDSTVGSPTWDAVKGVSLQLAAAPSAEVTITFDYIALVKDDPDAAEPNPYQSEGPDGTWTADWTQEGNGNFWIVEESGIIAGMGGDATGSYLRTANTYGNYKLSGITKAGTSGNSGFIKAVGERRVELGSGTLRALDSLMAWHSVTFAHSAGDKIYWKVIRDGTSLTGMASLDGVDWASVSTFCYAVLTNISFYARYASDRYYSLGLSSIEYAAEAGVAYRVEYLFYRNDTLFVKHAGATGDSLAHIVPDGMTKE